MAQPYQDLGCFHAACHPEPLRRRLRDTHRQRTRPIQEKFTEDPESRPAGTEKDLERVSKEHTLRGFILYPFFPEATTASEVVAGLRGSGDATEAAAASSALRRASLPADDCPTREGGTVGAARSGRGGGRTHGRRARARRQHLRGNRRTLGGGRQCAGTGGGGARRRGRCGGWEGAATGAEGRCGCDGLREGGVNDTTVNNRLDRYQKLSTKIYLDFATILLARSSINTN
jgi:hypothetical protein